VAGNDQVIAFYDKEGQALQRFDYSRDEGEKEFTAAAFNPSGEYVVVGSFNRFRTFSLNSHENAWQPTGVKQVENMYTVTCLAWKQDGSRLTVGTLCGAVDLYDACIRRVRYKGKFEFTYVSKSTALGRAAPTLTPTPSLTPTPTLTPTPSLTPSLRPSLSLTRSSSSGWRRVRVSCSSRTSGTRSTRSTSTRTVT
jgi:WD40 repeat protein